MLLSLLVAFFSSFFIRFFFIVRLARHRAGTMSSLIFIIIFLINYATFTLAKSPVMAKWSSAALGPDGPWQAVEVKLGVGDTVALYPGHLFQSYVITTDYCKHNNSEGCYASKAGTFNMAASMQDSTSYHPPMSYVPSASEFMGGIKVKGRKATPWIENMDAGALVNNVSTVLLDSQMLEYPSGQWYPAFAGCLGVGAPHTVNQTFEGDPEAGDATINASLIPGRLWELEQIHSNSFGLHIGSVSSEISGSLWWGAYDQNRVVGDIINSKQEKDTPGGFRYTLEDISIEVVDGISPFNFTEKKGGLIGAGNNTGESSLPVVVDGCSPYLTLPKATCDTIASYLPVEYSKDLGLYLWDTSSSKYDLIVASASTLSFTLTSDSSETSTTIRVPFPHLNLTLTRPLVDEPTPYFPCFTGSDEQFVLGRAFLQDAFLGANWNLAVWWLAQAPGPNIQQSSNLVNIQPGDWEIQSSSSNWADTWKGSWKALTEEEASGSKPVDASKPTAGSPTPSDIVNEVGEEHDSSIQGLGAEKKVGIAIGTVAALAVLVGFAFFCWRRKKAQEAEAAKKGFHVYHVYNNSGLPTKERRYDGSLVEAPGNTPQRQELQAGAVQFPPTAQRFEMA